MTAGSLPPTPWRGKRPTVEARDKSRMRGEGQEVKRLRSIVLLALVFVLSLSALPAAAKEGRNDRGPLTKITFIHYKKGHAKPDGVGGGKPKSDSCYTFLANGAKWKTTEDYLVNPTNSGLTASFVKDAVDTGVAAWEAYGGQAIFGASALSYDVAYDGSTMDNLNSASFGLYSDPNVIAVATVWGYFYGAPKTRQLVEWDILFNTYYPWGDATGDATVMDLQNIATHELGHTAGLGDLYNSCVEETMYGYSSEGELKKRTLHAGDIAGIGALYGN
jgi:hypothetical protein